MRPAGNLVEWKHHEWFRNLNLDLLPHDMSDAKGMQKMQCPYYIIYNDPADEPEKSAFDFHAGMYRRGTMRMKINAWFRRDKTDEDTETMEQFRDPMTCNSYVPGNRDLVLTCLIVNDYIDPQHGNKTRNGTPWRDRPYIETIRCIIHVKLYCI